MSAGPTPYPHLPPASGRAIAALVTGLVGFFFCCHLPGPVAWILAAQERRAIREGRASPMGEGYATAGLVLGIVSTMLLVFGVLAALVWLLLLGGLAILGSLAQT